MAKNMLIGAVFKANACVRILSLAGFRITVLACCEEVNNIEANVHRPSLAHLYNSVLPRYGAVGKESMAQQPLMK